MSISVLVGLVLTVGPLIWLFAKRFVIGRTWLIWPIVLSFFGAVFTGYEWYWQSFEDRLNSATAQIRDNSGSIVCERWTNKLWGPGNLGHVVFQEDQPEDVAFITSSVCSDARKFVADPTPNNMEGIVAVHRIAHNAAHLSGEQREARAECRAIDNDEGMMIVLGATSADAEKARNRYLKESYPNLPEDYLWERCTTWVTPGG